MTSNQEKRPNKANTSTPRVQTIPTESLMDIRLAIESATVNQIVRYSLKSKYIVASNRLHFERRAVRHGAV